MQNLIKDKINKCLDKFPEHIGWTEEQQTRFKEAMLTAALCAALYGTSTEGSVEREEIETKLSYANMTLTSLPALSLYKAKEYIKDELTGLFLEGVTQALSNLQ
jgi:hypothetical protein